MRDRDKAKAVLYQLDMWPSGGPVGASPDSEREEFRDDVEIITALLTSVRLEEREACLGIISILRQEEDEQGAVSRVNASDDIADRIRARTP